MRVVRIIVAHPVLSNHLVKAYKRAYMRKNLVLRSYCRSSIAGRHPEFRECCDFDSREGANILHLMRLHKLHCIAAGRILPPQGGIRTIIEERFPLLLTILLMSIDNHNVIFDGVDEDLDRRFSPAYAARS